MVGESRGTGSWAVSRRVTNGVTTWRLHYVSITAIVRRMFHAHQQFPTSSPSNAYYLAFLDFWADQEEHSLLCSLIHLAAILSLSLVSPKSRPIMTHQKAG